MLVTFSQGRTVLDGEDQIDRRLERGDHRSKLIRDQGGPPIRAEDAQLAVTGEELASSFPAALGPLVSDGTAAVIDRLRIRGTTGSPESMDQLTVQFIPVNLALIILHHVTRSGRVAMSMIFPLIK